MPNPDLLRPSPAVRRLALVLAVVLGLGCVPGGAALVVEPGGPAELVGPDARLQIVVTEGGGAAGPRDRTREVSYTSAPAGVVEVSGDGFVVPLAEGEAVVSVGDGSGAGESLVVSVRALADPPRVNFPNEVTPVFTKYGCNSGGCHGKVEGQNGFRLSLLGFEPAEDYEYLVKEGRGRRVFPTAPEFSLLLRKATGEIPHGGGSRIEVGSHPHRLLVRWIGQGMPFGEDGDAVVESVEVSPAHRVLQRGDAQQLRVTARFSDGTVRDITRLASYEPNLPEMAECSETGLVELGTGTGDVAVMVRFQEFVDVARFTVPLGAPVDEMPPENNFIDRYVFEKLRVLGLPPSGPADDATFLRRATVDIAGRLPTADEARAFAADGGDPAKRTTAVRALLGSDDHADYFAAKWIGLLRNKRRGDEDERSTRLLHGWVRDALAANMPFDRFATEIVAATGAPATNPPAGWFENVRDPKDQLQDVAQMFLGIRMQCAQCHHHPYEKWSQRDYYGLHAFFAQVGRKPAAAPAETVIFHRHGEAGAQNPKTGETLRPTPPGGEPPELAPEDDPRHALAGWMTRPANPFFARMLVNRYWKHFFGRGLVEPEDDMRLTNPATHPELLDRLAAEFVASGFDLRQLAETICTSQTYQLSAVPNEHNAGDAQNYSRFYPRRLPAEVLSDAIDALTGTPSSFEDEPPGLSAVELPDDAGTRSSYFLTVFGRPEMDSACECERAANANLAQTLHLLNAGPIQGKIASAEGRAAALAADGGRSVGEKVDALYHAALGRGPRPDEASAAVGHIEACREGGGEGGTAGGEQAGFEDLVWALVNTKEFLFNH